MANVFWKAVITMEQIVLASSSPRRKELLTLIGIPFKVHPSQKEEHIDDNDSPNEIVEKLALMKAKDIAQNYSEGLIIGADTIVVKDGKVLGKPTDKTEAFKMLTLLQGQVHQVYSGIALIDAKTGKYEVSHQVTKVFMKDLTSEEIHAYIGTKEPLDKAGAYGIQGIGALFIDKIEGDYFNVVGLPLSKLETMLKAFGVNVFKDLIHS